MLRTLHLRNLAIIRDVTLEFAPGFTVLTGETGAGKSILVDGLNLALGERADKSLVRSGCEEASAEALFDAEGAGPLLAEAGLEADGDGLVLKRVVTSAGKSRCAVNGALVPLAALKRLGDRLVDLHGQHEHQLLLDPRHHAEFLDAFGGLLPLRGETRAAFHGWRAAREELDRLRAADAERSARLDLLAYQVNELDAARLAPGEEETLAAERLRLANSAKLGAALAQAHDALLGEGGARETLGRAAAALRAAAEFDRPGAGAELEALRRLLDEAAEAGGRLRALGERAEADPARLEAVEERLDVIAKLARKHGGSVGVALERLAAARAELAALGSSRERIGELERTAGALRAALGERADRLGAGRRKAAKRFATAVEQELHELAMERAEFGVALAARPEPGPDGADDAAFTLAPNPGEGAKPLAAIASGGELSRVMLALKAVLAGVDRVDTLVFDEIDAGIGGRVAEVAGRKLADIGRARQVICITHLPQIAARATRHLVVRKRAGKDETRVEAEPVEGAARVEELARMLAGEAITPTARRHAAALLRGLQ